MTLFCSDIDGTLLNPQRTLSERTIAVVQAVLASGHHFVLCSSRMPSSMKLLEDLYRTPGGAPMPMIAYNGGLVTSAEGNVLIDQPIDVAAAKTIYEACSKLDLHASFYAADEWYAWGDDRWTDREANNTGVLPSADDAHAYAQSGRLMQTPPHKVMCMGDAELVDSLEAQLTATPSLVTYRSKDTYLEIANDACSKGDAVAAIANDLNVAKEDTVFFGDNYNDLSALEAVGHFVAVANAKEAVVNAAHHITLGHHEDGVAVVLDNWLKAS